MRQPIPLLRLFIPLTRKRFPYLTQLYSPSRDAAPAPSYFIMHVTGIDGKVKGQISAIAFVHRVCET